jgi:hypothetical protein
VKGHDNCPFCKGSGVTYSYGGHSNIIEGECDYMPNQTISSYIFHGDSIVGVEYEDGSIGELAPPIAPDRYPASLREFDVAEAQSFRRSAENFARGISGRQSMPPIDALCQALAPLVAIADAYDANELDDEARKFYGLNNEFQSSARDPSTIELYSGRGGRRLLTLEHCLAARRALTSAD